MNDGEFVMFVLLAVAVAAALVAASLFRSKATAGVADEVSPGRVAAFASKLTDFQRDDIWRSEFKGKLVEWPARVRGVSSVYYEGDETVRSWVDVSLSITAAGTGTDVGAEADCLWLRAQTNPEAERQLLLTLKLDDAVTVRGRLSHISGRNISMTDIDVRPLT